jgi:hypothetical protein
LLCALAALVLRLNAPAVQAVNYLVYPLQVALFAPFMRLGRRLFQFPAAVHGGAWRAVPGVLGAVAHALAGWLCIAAPPVPLSLGRRRGRARTPCAGNGFQV